MPTKIPSTIVNRAALAMTLALLAVPAGAGPRTLGVNDATASLPAMTAPDPATQERIRNALGKLPLHFEANTGQTDAQVKFLSRTTGYTLFLTPTEAVLMLAPKTKPSPQPLSQRERGWNLPSASGTTAGMPDSRDGGGRAASETAAEEVGPSRGQLPSIAGEAGESHLSPPLAGDEGMDAGDKAKPGAVAEDQSKGSVLRMRWLNANPAPKIVGAHLLAGRSSYFIDNDSAKWHTDVPHYAKVHYQAVYPGIDLVYYGNQSQIEYDFVVAPGADPNHIRLAIDGAENISLDAQGNLVLATTHGDLLQQAPIIYQEIDGERVAVEGTYVLHPNHEIGFEVASYDHERTLIIDPLLQATFLGGSGTLDSATALAIHPITGDVYVAGNAVSSDFPGIAGGADTTFGGAEAFVARLNSALTSLTQATFLGGSSSDSATALTIHPVSGDVYVVGFTNIDFPGIGGGADTTIVNQEAFVARLNSALTTLTQATFLGGSGNDSATAIAIHPVTGDVYVAGFTTLAAFATSSDFPNIAGGADTVSETTGSTQEAFVARLNSALTSLIQATLLGGSSFDSTTAIALHPVTGDVYVAGDTRSSDFPGIAGGADISFGGFQEPFVARLNSALTSIIQATFLGGSNGVATLESAFALAIHPVTGDVYMAGYTPSNDFPGIAGGADATFNQLPGDDEAFVARLNSALTSITQATFLGGSGTDRIHALAIHPISGAVYVAGYTNSGDFPGIAGGADITLGSIGGAFVARLSSALTSLTQATFLDGNVSTTGLEPANAIAIHPVSGDVYVAGDTRSSDFPGITGGADTTIDGQEPFIARLTADLAAAVASSANLSLTLTDAPDPITVGGNLTYTATITNNGPDAATGVTLTDTLPGSVTFVSSTPSQGSCSGTATVTCNLGALANTASATITMVVTPTTAGTLGNTASVTATEPDPNPTNNSATATTTVNAATNADLVLALSANPNPVGVNATLTYSHTITNNGPLSASAVVFTHTLPASGMSFGGVTSSQGSCSGTATVTCTLGTLANGASATVAITVTTTATGTLTSSASVSATQPDPNAANNSAVANVSVVQTICSNAGQRSASTDCSASVGPSAKGGGGAFDPFLLAGLLVLYLGRYWRNIRFAPAMAERARK